MNFIEKLSADLQSFGMWPDQAKAVIARLTEPAGPGEHKPMEGHWHKDVSGYPPMMYRVLWITAKREALKYIDETCPQAFFRPLFVT